jgi:hypothetical protein
MEQFNSLGTDSNIIIFFSHVWNWAILILYFVAVIIAVILVARDSRERGYGYLAVIGWSAMVLFIFPIGLALYLLLVHKDFHKWNAD